MAEENVTLTVKAVGSESNNVVDEVEQENQERIDKAGGGDPGKNMTSLKKAAKVGLALRAATVVMQEVSAWAEYSWNKELALNDDYIGQREKQLAMQAINKTVSFASSIAIGAIAGSFAGPGGAIAGAVISTASYIASTVRETVQALDQEQIRLRQIDASLGYTRRRAGYSTEAASIGEDL